MIAFIMCVCIFGAPLAIIALLWLAVTTPMIAPLAIIVVIAIILLTSHWVKVCK